MRISTQAGKVIVGNDLIELWAEIKAGGLALTAAARAPGSAAFVPVVERIGRPLDRLRGLLFMLAQAARLLRPPIRPVASEYTVHARGCRGLSCAL